VQSRIIRCASYVQRVDYGNRGKVQCVRFAYLLMDKLREPGQRLFSGGDTAGAYFVRLDSSGKTSKPLANGRPKDQSKPLYVWWNRNSPSIPDGYSTARVNGGSCLKCQWTPTK
jgi:hypothetical protein